MTQPTNPTPRQVLDKARLHKFSIFPLQCYIQRQQLKFLWRVTHSSDRSIPRIALNGRLFIAGHKYGGGGQQKTYRACIADALLAFGTTFDMCTTSSQSEWYKFVEGPGLLLASAHWESQRPAFQKIDRVYSKSGANPNSANRRRMIIQVNDDDADAWVDDYSYHDTTNPRPEPILPRRIRHTARGTTRVAKKRKATSQKRMKRRLSVPSNTTKHPPENPPLQETAGPSPPNGNDTNRRIHQNLPLPPRFIGDCRKAGFPNPLTYEFQCLHGYSVDGSSALTFQPNTKQTLVQIFRQLRGLPIHYTGSKDGIAAALHHIREYITTTDYRCFKFSILSDRTTLSARFAMTNPNGLCGLIVIFQLWERAAHLASNPDCTDYIIYPVDLDNPLRRDKLVHFAQAVLGLNTDNDKADLRRCTKAMLTWIRTHYPRPSLHSRIPTFPRTAWYDAAFYNNLALPGAAPFTFFTTDLSIANTFKDQPPQRHYLTANAHHLATSADGTGYFRFRDIRNISTTGPSDFQYDKAHFFFPLFMQLPTLRPTQLNRHFSSTGGLTCS